MKYRIVTIKPYWINILKGDLVVAMCVRKSNRTWYLFTNTKERIWIGENYESVEEAFEAFLAYVKTGKGFTKKPNPVNEPVQTRSPLVSNNVFSELWIYFVTMQQS